MILIRLVIIPVLHGLYGEDGTIQGLFELIKVPYVGCKVLASSVGMDKVYSKIIFEKAGLNQTKYIYLRNCGDKYIYIDVPNYITEKYLCNSWCSNFHLKVLFW